MEGGALAREHGTRLGTGEVELSVSGSAVAQSTAVSRVVSLAAGTGNLASICTTAAADLHFVGGRSRVVAFASGGTTRVASGGNAGTLAQVLTSTGTRIGSTLAGLGVARNSFLERRAGSSSWGLRLKDGAAASLSANDGLEGIGVSGASGSTVGEGAPASHHAVGAGQNHIERSDNGVRGLDAAGMITGRARADDSVDLRSIRHQCSELDVLAIVMNRIDLHGDAVSKDSHRRVVRDNIGEVRVDELNLGGGVIALSVDWRNGSENARRVAREILDVNSIGFLIAVGKNILSNLEADDGRNFRLGNAELASVGLCSAGWCAQTAAHVSSGVSGEHVVGEDFRRAAVESDIDNQSS